MLDGYVVAPEGTEVKLGNGVRHIAQLESGEVFVAFTGEVPCAGALLLNDNNGVDLDGWWFQVRRVTPSGPEAFYLLSQERFDALDPAEFAAASKLVTGNVLVQTQGNEIAWALWGSKAVSYIDERVPVSA